ncbi:MAG TPA: class I SAM-dependent methyltransferase [Chryseosolibacter sp.]
MNSLNRFNWIARYYDRLVSLVFGRTLYRAQLHFLNSIHPYASVLILGGGSGRFLQALLTVQPSVKVTYIEASSSMLLLSRKKVNDNPNVVFIHGTHLNIPDINYDVVITNFVLDVFPQDEIESVVKRISTSLKTESRWLITDFEKSQRWQHRFMLKMMYLFFRVTGSVVAKDLPAWRPIVLREGFQPRGIKFFYGGFVSANLYVRNH